MLTGIVLPGDLKLLPSWFFLCPFTNDRKYEITLVLNKNLERFEWSPNNFIDEIFDPNSPGYNSTYHFENPISKYILNGNRNFTVHQDGKLISDGWGIVGASNTIEELCIPYGIGSIRGCVFAPTIPQPSLISFPS